LLPYSANVSWYSSTTFSSIVKARRITYHILQKFSLFSRNTSFMWRCQNALLTNHS
jgi:hypothetical protein